MTQAGRAGLSCYTAEGPLALLTDYPPDTAGGGAVILRSLLGPEERSYMAARKFWLVDQGAWTDL